MNDNAEDKVMVVFAPSKTISNVVAPGTWNGQVRVSNPSQQAVNASGFSPALIVFGGIGARSGSASFNVESPAFDAEVAASDGDGRVGYKIYNASPQDHSIDGENSGGAVGLVSGALEVS